MAADDPRRWMWAEALAMIERAEGLHRQFFQPGRSARQLSWEPPVDIFETEEELRIIVGTAGGRNARSRRVDRRPDAGDCGTSAAAFDTRGAAIHRIEIPYGRFERRIRLPAARFEAYPLGTRAWLPLCQPHETGLIADTTT